MFKVNNKTPLASFWYLYCKLWAYSTPCSSVSIVNFEPVIAGWVVIYLLMLRCFYCWLSTSKYRLSRGLFFLIWNVVSLVECCNIVTYLLFFLKPFFNNPIQPALQKFSHKTWYQSIDLVSVTVNLTMWKVF